MWECKICRRLLEDEDEACWSCNGKKEDVELLKERKVEEDNIIEIAQPDANAWECKNCRRLLDKNESECWSCGGKREDVELK